MPKKSKRRNNQQQRRQPDDSHLQGTIEQTASQPVPSVQEDISGNVAASSRYESSGYNISLQNQANEISEIPNTTLIVSQPFHNQGTPQGAEGGIDLTTYTEQQIAKSPELVCELKNQMNGSHENIQEDKLSKDLEQLEISMPMSTEKQNISRHVPITVPGIRAKQKANLEQLKINTTVTPTIEQNFLPKRPDAGGNHRKSIDLIINCLNVSIKPIKIFMYDIELTKAEVMGYDQRKRDITLRVKKKDNLRNVMKKFLEGKAGCPVFDGGRIIFNNKSLPFDDEVQNLTFDCDLDGDDIVCYFAVQHVKDGDIDLANLIDYVKSGRGRSNDMPQEALRALDTIMREMFLNKNLISIGRRAIFDPRTSVPMKCGPYVLMDGYATTIRPHMSKIRFNFDKTQIVCHKPMNLLDYISIITDLKRGLNIKELTPKLRTLRVQSNHLKNKEGKSYSRKYTIFGFSRGNAKEERIPEKNITIEEYFLTEHGIQLKCPNLKMIKTNPCQNTFVPIELLELLPYQKVIEDRQIIAEVIKHSAIPCYERLDKLRRAITDLGLADRTDKYMKNYMIEIEPNLINVTARILEGPEAIFGNQKKELVNLGKWDIRGKKFFSPHDKNVNWAFFAVGTERDYQRDEICLFDVEAKLPNAAKQVGIIMSSNYHFYYVAHENIENVASNVIKDSEKNNCKLDLLVFVVRTTEDYRAVKIFGDVVCGIATQCMNFSNLARQRNLDQYLGNIMLKINGKLGGTNWELPAISNSTFTPINGPFMVFGIDVTHPSATRNDLAESIAAMVGSLDHAATLYSAVIRQQISKKERSIVEVVLDMEDMVHELLLKFYQVNRKEKPKHLIFYRDGVSEGQFEIVFKHEIIAIQKACRRLAKNYQPLITYIVVQKRHKIRFFPKDSRQGIGKSGNVPSGTLIDKDITHCREFDFYLCSHEGIQGTSKPAHYHVLYDENNWGSDDLQSFTYLLCHAYARCTRSVSYPAPTYYAHLAAFRGRTLIGQPDDDNISVSSIQSFNESTADPVISIKDFHLDKLFFV